MIKPLALATLAPFALGWALLGDGPVKIRWYRGVTAGAVAVAGIAAWVLFPYGTDLDNPLIRNRAFRATTALGEVMHATDLITTSSYVSRYFTWVVTRGISWPGFALAGFSVFAIFRALREKTPVSKGLRVALAMALFSPFYWALVKGPQYTGPWYSLHVLPGLATMAAYGYLKIRSTWMRAALIAAIAISSIPKITWTLDALDEYRRPVGSAFQRVTDHVDCDVRPIIRAVF